MLHFREYGSGHPVIILHGLFGMLDNWHSFAKKLSVNKRVISVDLRNHGRSFHSAEMSYDLMASDLKELLEYLGLKSASFIGHSMGGKAAIKLALDHPYLIDDLVVLDILPGAYEDGHVAVFKALESLDLGSITSRKEAEEHLVKELDGDNGTSQFLLKSLKRREEGGYEWKFNLAALKNHYANIRGAVIGDEYMSPVLFIGGSESGYITENGWIETLKLFPLAELEYIDGAGHWLHVDSPDTLFDLIIDYMR